MKTILIGTTAINRPPLHIDTLTDWYNWINKLKNYNIKWFINIDIIEKLDYTYEETQNNLKNIIKDIDIIFLKCEDNKGNFLKACQRISSNIENYVNDNNLNKDDVIIFWLEDDWKLNLKISIPLEEIINNYLSNLCYINFSFIKNNYIHALAPSIINYNLWSKLHLQAWKQQKEHIDPEHCVGLYYINYFGKYININNLTIISDFKNINEGFFENNFLKYSKSFYTYDNNIRIIKDNYIKKEDCKNFCKDKITFIRITNSFCIDGCDYGRIFMEKNNLYKSNVQNKNNINFYTFSSS